MIELNSSNRISISPLNKIMDVDCGSTKTKEILVQLATDGVAYDNKTLFLTILEAEKSKMKVPTWSPSGEGSLSSSWQALSLCVLTWWKG